jgi:hypothetical protein
MVCCLSNEDLVRAVDLEVSEIVMNVPSESTQTRDEFRNNLLERDVCCLWTMTIDIPGIGAKYLRFNHTSFHMKPSDSGKFSCLFLAYTFF